MIGLKEIDLTARIPKFSGMAYDCLIPSSLRYEDWDKIGKLMQSVEDEVINKITTEVQDKVYKFAVDYKSFPRRRLFENIPNPQPDDLIKDITDMLEQLVHKNILDCYRINCIEESYTIFVDFTLKNQKNRRSLFVTPPIRFDGFNY